MEYSDKLHGPQVILPHADWRGTYARGTTLGNCFVYGTNGQFATLPADSTPNNGDGTRIVGGQYDGSAEHCISVDWPAAYTWSARQYRRGYDGPISWMGSLIYESRDASGLYYRRNRYYDSEKGRFTQEDPIGLAGGVNVYGFANGDPVSYRDPYGLTADTMKFTGEGNGATAESMWQHLMATAQTGVASADAEIRSVSQLLLSLMQGMEISTTTYVFEARDFPDSWENDTGGGSNQCNYNTNSCLSRIDTQPRGEFRDFGFDGKVAHEVVGAGLEMTLGRVHWADNGAIEVENWLRTIKHCTPRAHHWDRPTGCP